MKLAMNVFGYCSYPEWLPCYTIEETINRVASIGFDGIEIGAASPHAWPRYLGKERRRELVHLLNDCGLEVSALCPAIGGGPGFNPASPLQIEREESVRYYRECIELAADLGSKIVLYLGGWQVFGTPYDQAWEWSSETLRACVENAEKFGVTLAVEPTSAVSNIINSADDALKMMKNMNSKKAGVMFDTFHVLTKTADAFTPIDYVKKMGADLVYVHVSDVRRLPPGTETDFRPIIAALKNIGYEKYLSVEIWGPDLDDFGIRAFNYLKPLLE